MTLTTVIRIAVALAIFYSLIPSTQQGESITLRLQQDQDSVCYDQPVRLMCQHSDVTSGLFLTTKPSWKEDGAIVSLDGGMYRSVTQINETHTVLELVPERSHFEPSGAHNYTCFLHLVEGGVIESNPVQIHPIKELLNVVQVNETGVKIKWNHSRACFKGCNVTFNLTWTTSHQGQSESVETNDTMYCITSLKRDEVYEVTFTALCREQSSVTVLSKTVVVAFSTFSGTTEMETSSSSHQAPLWPVIGGIVGSTFLFVAMVILIILLSICIHMKWRKPKSRSSLNHNAKGRDSGLPVHVYDTVSNVTEGVQFQANPCYNPMMQSLQLPTETEVSMQANPSYVTANDLTGL